MPVASQPRLFRFEGQVQGVGFRYKTAQIAQNYAVAGRVKNLADGSVELVVQGASEVVDAFVADIQCRLGEHIEQASESSAATPPNLRDLSFTIE